MVRLTLYCPHHIYPMTPNVIVDEATTVKEIIQKHELPTDKGVLYFDGAYISSAPFTDALNNTIAALLNETGFCGSSTSGHIFAINVKMAAADLNGTE